MASCLRRFLHAWNPLKTHGAYEADGILDGMLTKQPFLLKSRNRIGENVQLTFPSLSLSRLYLYVAQAKYLSNILCTPLDNQPFFHYYVACY